MKKDGNLSRLRLGRVVAAAFLLALLGWAVWKLSGGNGEPAKATEPPAVPVAVTQVRQEDVPHLSSGIGTVQPLQSVTLRPQVEGVLTEVLFREGEFVRRGDLLARIDDRAIAAALDQARAEKAQNVADLQAAELDLTRYNNLVRDQAIPRQTVERQAALVAKLRATINANEAAIAAAQVQLSHTRITSPLSGRVGIRRVDPGNLVRPTDAEGLVTVTQMRPIAVTFTLPQELLPRIQPLLKDPAAAPVTAFDRAAGAPLGEGRLTIVDNQIDAATGTIRLKAQFANDDGRLWPGQFVTVQLRTGLSPKALVLPTKAVQRALEGSFVFRVRDGKAEAVPVTIEHANDEIAVIGRGLAVGDTVVVDGQSRLKPGAPVRIVTEGAAGAPGGRP